MLGTRRLGPAGWFVLAQGGIAIAGAAAQLAAGSLHTCARTDAGGVSCWGSNSAGQLGDGTTNEKSPGTPVAIPGLVGVLEVTTGAFHTCARLADGSVRCWGWNASGQVGNGTTDLQSIPSPVTGLSRAVALAAGGYHTCAVIDDGTLSCWGNNLDGELGGGQRSTRRVIPAPVPGLQGVVAVVAGMRHTCALLDAGTVWCWGANDRGQLGDALDLDRPVPGMVPGVQGATAVAAGADHTCVALIDGRVRCWGADQEGQLGTGAIAERGGVHDVLGIRDVVGVAAGGSHTCVRGGSGSALVLGERHLRPARLGAPHVSRLAGAHRPVRKAPSAAQDADPDVMQRRPEPRRDVVGDHPALVSDCVAEAVEDVLHASPGAALVAQRSVVACRGRIVDVASQAVGQAPQAGAIPGARHTAGRDPRCIRRAARSGVAAKRLRLADAAATFSSPPVHRSKSAHDVPSGTGVPAQCPVASQRSSVHRLPSSQSVSSVQHPGIRVDVHPSSGSQPSCVHESPSSHNPGSVAKSSQVL